MRIARNNMILLIAAAFAAEPCRFIHLVRDDAHAVERRGWKDGAYVPPVGYDMMGGSYVMSTPHAPNVAQWDEMSGPRTMEYAPVTVDAKRGTGCLNFGDVRAFEMAYRHIELPNPFMMVTVNGTIAADEDGAMLFPARATSFMVNGLKAGDIVNVLVVAEGFQTVPRCRGIPTMDEPVGAETVCDRGYLLWERREYVY